MNVLIPITITAAMIQASTSIAEPDLSSGEVAWVSGAAYVVDNLRVSTTAHKVFSCVKAHSGRAILPENDPEYWLKKTPSMRWAPFDKYISTAATAIGSITYTLCPGFFNAISIYGLVGSSIAVTVKDAPGGSVIFTYTADLFEPAAGLYELLFTPLVPRTKLVMKDILISPTAELTIVVSAGATDPVAIGMINVGDYRRVIGQAQWGGTEYGSSVELNSFSFIDFKADGTSEILQRGNGEDLHGTVVMPASAGRHAMQVIKQVLDVPVSCIAIDFDGYDYMNTFGLLSGSLVIDDFGTATLTYSVKGSI